MLWQHAKNIFKTNNFPEQATTPITKIFIQPSFGYSSNYFAAAFSSKFSFSHFGSSTSSVSKENNPVDYDYIQYLKGKSYFWWEPGLMCRGGLKKVQVISQINYSAGHKNLPLYNINYSLGIILPIGAKPKQEQTST